MAPEVLAVLKHLERKGMLEIGKSVRDTIGTVLLYAIATARAESDPTTALAGASIAPKVKHCAGILDPAALAAFLRTVEEFDGQFATKAERRQPPLVFRNRSRLETTLMPEGRPDDATDGRLIAGRGAHMDLSSNIDIDRLSNACLRWIRRRRR